jgi:hypothetical protein
MDLSRSESNKNRAPALIFEYQNKNQFFNSNDSFRSITPDASVRILKESAKVFEILRLTILFGTRPVVNSL